MIGRTISMVFISGVLFSGCGNGRQEPSRVDDLATPGELGAANALYWIDGENIFRGNCTANAVPTRGNCGLNVASGNAAKAKEGTIAVLAKDVASSTANRDLIIKKLKDADPVVISLRQEIATLTASVNSLGTAVKNFDISIAAQQKVLDADNVIVADLASQLAAVDAALANKPGDAELTKLRAELVLEKAHADAVSADDAQKLAELVNARTQSQTALTADSEELAATKAQLDAFYASLVVNSPELVAVKKLLADLVQAQLEVETVFGFIATAGVSYRANLLSVAQRAVIERIPLSSLILKAGIYRRPSSSGFDCNHKIAVSTQQNTLAVSWIECSATSGIPSQTTFTCNDQKICKASISGQGDRQIRVINSTSYEYSSSTTKDIRTFAGTLVDPTELVAGPAKPL